MIYKLFKFHRPSALLVLLFITIVLWWSGAQEKTADISHNFVFFENFLSFLNGSFWIKISTGVLLTLIGGIILNQLFNRQDILERATYLPAVIYCLGLSTVLGNLVVKPIHFALLFILVALIQFLQIYRAESAKIPVFNGGLFMGIAHLIEPGIWPMTLLGWFTLSIIRPFSLREYLLSAIGTAVPFLYAVVYFIANDSLSLLQGYFNFQIHTIDVDTFLSNYITLKWVIAGLIFLTSFLGVLQFLANAGTSGLRFKKIMRFIFTLLFLSVITSFLGLTDTYENGEFIILILPISIIIPYYLLTIKKQRIASVIFHLGLLILLYNFFFNIYSR